MSVITDNTENKLSQDRMNTSLHALWLKIMKILMITLPGSSWLWTVAWWICFRWQREKLRGFLNFRKVYILCLQHIIPEEKKCSSYLRFRWSQGFGREKDGNRGKFIGSNLVIFCYKEFEKFVLCKSVSQSEVIFIVYSQTIERGHVKINFS